MSSMRTEMADAAVRIIPVVFLMALLVALLVHEAGHAGAALALHLPVRPTLTRHGPAMIIGSEAIRLTRLQIAITAAAGPAANFVFAAIAYAAGRGVFCAVSIEIGGFNLIPIANSDGHRIIHGYGKGATP